MKHELSFGGELNAANCRRLMKDYIDMIDCIKDIFIKTNKGIVSNDEVFLVTN